MSFCRPYLRFAATSANGYTPDRVAALYGFPKVPSGCDPVIAIGELGGGYEPSDINAYFTQRGLPAPQITNLSVRGATNAPTGDASGPDGEVMLDILVAAAAYSYSTGKPAQLLLVWAPNDEAGMADAVTAALQHASKPAVFSWSWGAPEDAWPKAAIQQMETALQAAAQAGMTVTAAAGDNGSSDGEQGNHADYPASSAYVLGCGGTTLQSQNGQITSEIVWNDGAAGDSTGGGFSSLFPRPAWQNTFVPGNSRGVPDVCGNADPATGYWIRVDGQEGIVGGTSAVAPLWAALLAVYGSSLNRRLGLINPLLYQAETTFRDVVSGNDGAWSALIGWDACTGLGSPDGQKLLTYLAGGGWVPPPPPKSPSRSAVESAVNAGVLHGLQQTLERFGHRMVPPATVLNVALPIVTAAVNGEVAQVFGS